MKDSFAKRRGRNKMMISTKAKIAFLAMPRNASTSIEASLLPYADIAFKGLPRFKHLNLSMYNLRLRPFLDANNHTDIKTVALFREPLSWMQSWFKYRSDPGIKLKRNSTAGLSFNEFVEAYLQDDRPDFANIGQQSLFVRDKTSDCGIDLLFKFENLEQLQSLLQEKLSRNLKFDHINTSINRDIDLAPSLELALKDRLKQDYDIYETFAL